MANNNTLTIYLDAIAEKFQKVLKAALGDLNKFGEQAEKAGNTLSIAISLPLGLISKKSLEAFGDVDALARGLATLEKNAGTLTARLKELDAIPNLGFKDATKADLQLRTVLEQMYGIDGAAKTSKEAINVFNNALKLTGKGSEEFNRAIYGLQQLAGTEFPLGEDLNIIKEAIPQVTPLLNEAFGSARSDDLQKMKISSQQVIDTIVKGLGKLPQATIGVKAAFEQFSESIEKRLAQVGERLSKNINFQKIFDMITGAIDKAIAAFDSLSPTMQKSVIVFGALAIALPPILAGLGAFVTTILPAMKAGFAALTGPMGLVTLAVTAAVALIIANWDKVKKVLVDTGIWDKLVSTAKFALGLLQDVFSIFSGVFTGDWAKVWDNIKNIFKRVWNALVSIAAWAFSKVFELGEKFFKWVGLDTLAAGADIANRGIKKLADSITAEVPAATQALDALSNSFDGFTFGGDNRTVTGKKKNDNGDAKKAAEAAREAFKKVGNEPLKFSNTLLGAIIGANDKSEAESKIKDILKDVKSIFGDNEKEFAQVSAEALAGKDFGANLQKRFDAIQIKMPKRIISNSEEVQRQIDEIMESVASSIKDNDVIKRLTTDLLDDIANGLNPAEAIKKALDKIGNIEDVFKKLKSDLSDKVDPTFFKSIGDKIAKAIANGIDPEKAYDKIGKPIVDVFERLEEELRKAANPELYRNISEQIQKAIADGMNPKDAFDKFAQPVITLSTALAEAMKAAVMAVLDSLGDLIAGVFEEAFGGKKLDLKVITSGLLSSLGGIVMDLGKTAIAIGLGVGAIKESLHTLNPAIALAAGVGLLALGAALRGAGSAIAGKIGGGGASGGSNGASGAPAFRPNTNSSFNVNFEIKGTSLVGVLKNTQNSYG